MSEELNILDEVDREMVIASKGNRFANLLIDTIAYYAIAAIIGFVCGALGLFTAEGADALGFSMYGVYFLYFFGFEAATGKTLGKIITKTKVVTETGEKPSTGQIAGRAACRFIPFEAFSFLGQKGIGWHDTITKTRVIKA